MKKTKVVWSSILVMLLCLVSLLYVHTQTKAEERTIALGAQGEDAVFINYRDMGKFVLDYESDQSIYKPYADRIAYIEYELQDMDDESIGLDEDGYFETRGIGRNYVIVTVHDENGEPIEEIDGRSYLVIVNFDMTNVTLDKDSFTVYKSAFDTYSESEFSVKVNGLPDDIDEDTVGLEYEVSSSNASMSVRTEFYDGEITIHVSGSGTTQVTIRINGKDFIITVTIKEVKLSGSTSFYMTPKQTKQLKVKNGEGAAWKSTNSNVVSVSSTGKIKAKKAGNAVISAKVGDIKVGCVISVVSKTRLKVVKRARYIGTHWKYSQPKRMKSGYYDCSSLVWKSYKYEKKYFGAKSYAPVAADVAKYCVKHKKKVSGGIWSNIQKMKYKPGALTFKTGAKNGRYKGVYHVEMFVGYSLEGFESDGTPILGTKWAARGDNYDYGSLWAQP